MSNKFKTLLLFTFLGEKGGIPQVEKNFLNGIKYNGIESNYILASKLDYDFLGEKIKISNNFFTTFLNLFTYLLKNKYVNNIFYEFHTFPLFIYKIILNKNYFIKIHDLFFISDKNIFVMILTILNSIFAKKIITPSFSTKKNLEILFNNIYLKFLNKKIVVIYNSYDINFINYLEKIKKETNNLSDINNNLIGKKIISIIASENIDFLINGFKLINSKYKNKYTLAIAGNYNKNNYINEENIIFTGYLNKENITKLYNKSELILYNNYNEGFGYIPLESMLSGVSIITNGDLAIGEILGEFGNYYTDYESYINLLDSFYKGNIILNKEKAIDYVRKYFTPEINFKKEINLINN